MTHFLAVDGGGTKTQVILANEQGQQLGEGWSGPTSLTATSVGAASFNLREAVRQALESVSSEVEIAAMVMGLAGMDTPNEEAQALHVFKQVLDVHHILRFQLVNDIVIALESGSDSPNAVALIAGTGSNCWGRNQSGQTAKSSGMDFLLTDQGSAYAIGRQVLREAVRSFDGRSPKSILEQLVREYFHISSIAELKDHVYNPLLTKTEIGELAKLCSDAEQQGDEVAKTIFAKTAHDLLDLVKAVVTRLELQAQTYDLVLVGGVSKLPAVSDQFLMLVKEFSPQVQIVQPEQDPVHGALKLAFVLAQSSQSSVPLSQP